MTREDILSTTQRIRDLHYFYEILTSETPGAERAWEAMDDLNFPNAMALTSYLMENKDFFLRYCDDEASRVRTAKTALLMFAAAVDGRSEKKDALLADIADNKIHVYNFEWNQANTWRNKDSEWSIGAVVSILSELSLDEKIDIYNDVVSIFKADGVELSERKKQNLGYLKDDLGLEGDSDEDETGSEVDDEFEDENDGDISKEGQQGAVKTKYIFTHPGECRYMPQRLMEATYTDILTKLRLDDPDERATFLAMDRSGAEKMIHNTYRDVVSHASPSLMRIVNKEGQGDPNSYAGLFLENLVSKIYDSVKVLQAENGDDILYPDAPDLLKPLPCLKQVLSSAGFLQMNLDRRRISPGSLRYLKVIGTINAFDFRFLREVCTDLMVLDISDALVGDYEGEEGSDENITYYDSLEIPLGAFCYGKYRNGKAGHQSLQIVLFHEDTYLIQRGAFQGCSRLDNVFLPPKMEVIDEKAFKDCENLEYIYLGGTKLIKNGAFNGCKQLKDIVCPGNPPALGNPNQSAEMKRFATPIFTPHESAELGLDVRAVKVPSDKISTYEQTEWADVSHISPGEFDGRDLFEFNIENNFKWMAERDCRMAMWDFITAGVCDDAGNFSASAQKTIIDLLQGSLPLNEDDFHHVLKNPDLDRSAEVLGALSEDKKGEKELKKFFQNLHTAIAAEGVNDNRIHIMHQALCSVDVNKFEEMLGDAMGIYFPDASDKTAEKGKAGTQGQEQDVSEKPETRQKAETSTPVKKESAKGKGAPKESWTVIGSFNSWNKDIAMTKVMDGIWISPWIRCSAGDAFKVRCNGSWDKNVGGVFSEIGKAFKAIPNGDNIIVPSSGKYIVTLNSKESTIILTKEDGLGEEEERKPSLAKSSAAKKEDKPLPVSKKTEPKKATSNKPETAGKSKAAPVPEPTRRAATINSVKADHNVVVDGKKGVTLHINFDIANCEGVDCRCGAWLYYANGKRVKDTNGSFCASDGQVSTSVLFKPKYEKTHFDDLQLFLPYDEFHIKGKNVGCYLSLQVQSDSGACISPEYKENIVFSSENNKTVRFDKIWYEDLKNEDFIIHIKFTIDHALNEDGRIAVWFYNFKGAALKAKSSEMAMYKTTDGKVTVQLPLKPNYESCSWNDLRMSIPYSALNLASDYIHDLQFRVGVFFGETHLPYSEYVSFKVEAKRGLFSGIKYKLFK